MHIPILIEPQSGGSFRARAGEPFAISADGKSATDAASNLAELLRARLKTGAQLGLIDLGNGSQLSGQTPLHLTPLPEDDWFFQTMGEVIAENRRQEAEAQRLEDEAAR